MAAREGGDRSHCVGSQEAQLTFSFLFGLFWDWHTHIQVDTLIEILRALSPGRFRLTVKINSICWASTIHSMITKKHLLGASYRAWFQSARRINHYKPHFTVPKDQDLEQDMLSIVCHCCMTSEASVGPPQEERLPNAPAEWCLLSAEPWPGAGHPVHFSTWPGFLTAGLGFRSGHPKGKGQQNLFLSRTGLCRASFCHTHLNCGSQVQPLLSH